jgi:hypothetical protein
VGGGFVDDAEVHAAARELAGERQAGGSRSYDQYGCLRRILVRIQQRFALPFILIVRASRAEGSSARAYLRG